MANIAGRKEKAVEKKEGNVSVNIWSYANRFGTVELAIS